MPSRVQPLQRLDILLTLVVPERVPLVVGDVVLRLTHEGQHLAEVGAQHLGEGEANGGMGIGGNSGKSGTPTDSLPY